LLQYQLLKHKQGTMVSVLHILNTLIFFGSSLAAVTKEESSAGVAIPAIPAEPWVPATKSNGDVTDLHHEYNRIFTHGNRNAASHLWSTFLLERSTQMTRERLEMFFTGFCAVSGSPVRPNDYNRYRLMLGKVGGGHVSGFMHYCCWPCVCDTQDFIKIDTLSVTTLEDNGMLQSNQMQFAVIGNPCDHPEELEKPFHQPFSGGRTTTLRKSAPEVRCLRDGTMEGAILSDNGYIIISMFFDATEELVTSHDKEGVSEGQQPPQPGRITIKTKNDGNTILFQDEREYGPSCNHRANNGHNSGMGEIFRKVCAISPIPTDYVQL